MAKTVDEISKLAGVSITTVRLVINGQAEKYRISKKTQNKVHTLIDEYGYVLNQTARNLKLQKTNTIGLVVPRLSNLFFSELAEALEAECRIAGYQLITVTSEDDETREKKVTDNLYARDIDGLFIAPCSLKRQQKLQQGPARGKKKPLVYLDRDFGVEQSIVVASDNEAGAYEMGKKLAPLSDEFYFIGGDPSFTSMQYRIKGIKAGLQDQGIELSGAHIQIDGKNTRENGHAQMDALIKALGRPPNALISGSLPILEGAIVSLKKHYGRIPEEMLIGSFDDHAMLDFLPNKVIAMQQDSKHIASAAMKKMLTLVAGEQLEHPQELLQPKLIIR